MYSGSEGSGLHFDKPYDLVDHSCEFSIVFYPHTCSATYLSYSEFRQSESLPNVFRFQAAVSVTKVDLYPACTSSFPIENPLHCLSFVSSNSDMIKSTEKFDSQRAGHFDAPVLTSNSTALTEAIMSKCGVNPFVFYGCFSLGEIFPLYKPFNGRPLADKP